MPELDGTELIARIRDRELEHDYTYILLLTGRAGEAASREAVRAGADDVLAKPLDAAELERKLIAAERIRGVHRRMREDARRDPLTGAGSRQRLEEDLASVCARVVRYGHAYCIAMVGLEPAGDDVLRRAGSALVREIRSGDAVYRSGPGEFAVLLPEQALETANLAAERLRRALTFAVPDDTKVNVGHRDHVRHRPGTRRAAQARGDRDAPLVGDRRRRGLRDCGVGESCGWSSPTTTRCHG